MVISVPMNSISIHSPSLEMSHYLTGSKLDAGNNEGTKPGAREAVMIRGRCDIQPGLQEIFKQPVRCHHDARDAIMYLVIFGNAMVERSAIYR